MRAAMFTLVAVKKRARRAWNKHVKLRWWSVRNWCKGYKYGPVQRFRCCSHTTPFHYQACAERDLV